MPWRVTKKSKKKDYYRLLSEFMLQQTQVKTVLPYFKKFIKRFKSLKSLSKAKEKDVLKMWEGLGYYRRARNLLNCSKELVKNHNSKIPNTLEELKKLPGIGEYTGNALLGLIHNKPVIALDGNVKRIFARILNRSQDEIEFNQLIYSNKNKLFKTGRNSDLVEALMEFGALVCKPKDPKCSCCNLKQICKYFKSSKKNIITKTKMTKIKNYDIFCYVHKNKKIALTKKNQTSFLKNFNLPKIKESNGSLSQKNWKFLKSYKNSISNLKLNINLYYKFSNKIPSDYSWYSIKRNKEFVPSFTKKIFRQVSTLF